MWLVDIIVLGVALAAWPLVRWADRYINRRKETDD